MLLDELISLGKNITVAGSSGGLIGRAVKVISDEDVLVPVNGKYPNSWPQDATVFLVGIVKKNFAAGNAYTHVSFTLRTSDTVSGGNLSGTISTLAEFGDQENADARFYNDKGIMRWPFPGFIEFKTFIQMHMKVSAVMAGSPNAVLEFAIAPWSGTQRVWPQAAELRN